MLGRRGAHLRVIRPEDASVGAQRGHAEALGAGRVAGVAGDGGDLDEALRRIELSLGVGLSELLVDAQGEEVLVDGGVVLTHQVARVREARGRLGDATAHVVEEVVVDEQRALLQRAGRREVGNLREEASEQRAQLRELVLIGTLLAVVMLTEAGGDLCAQRRAVALERRRVPRAEVRRQLAVSDGAPVTEQVEAADADERAEDIEVKAEAREPLEVECHVHLERKLLAPPLTVTRDAARPREERSELLVDD